MSVPTGNQTLRIIAGQWRGRKIHFPANPALRPTPDRVRETLFNWLMPVVDGARCLDLFAGSGILGLEALSRGAGQVEFVDNHHGTIASLRETCQSLATDKATLFNSDAVDYLKNIPDNPRRFDIVFLDPPYRSTELLVATAGLLQADAWLNDSAYIYVEHDQDFDTNNLPSQWQIHRQKQAGQVCYALYTCTN